VKKIEYSDMQNIYDKGIVKEIVQRIDSLTPESQRQWGKMNVAQMLAHCCISMEVVIGRQKPPRIFIGRLIAPFLKKTYYDDQPFRKNSPTAKSFVVTDEKDMEREREKLKLLIQEFVDNGPEKCTIHPHAFFGKYTAEQWGIATYKHFDHHLRQFGV
jgi:hypothetical protein